jgi:hypothetical protein
VEILRQEFELIQVAILSLQFLPMSFKEAHNEIQGFLRKEDLCRYDPPNLRHMFVVFNVPHVYGLVDNGIKCPTKNH